MIVFLLVICVILFALLVYALVYGLRMRDQIKRAKDWAPSSKIPMILPAEMDSIFVPEETGVARASEIFYIGTGTGAPCLTSDMEAWILAVLSKKAMKMFEFGTASGRTTYLWAKNSPPNASITTITLHPDQLDCYKKESSDNYEGEIAAVQESIFSQFVYSGTPVESKIRQLFGDSKAFDETPFTKCCDLIFIDGSHSYSYVKSDTEKALKMIASGGMIVWHDYRDDLIHTRGVVQFLNEISSSIAIKRIQGTSLAFCRFD